MDCKTARMLSELRGNRISELPDEDAASLDRHLAACADCQAILRTEEKLDAPLLKAMTAVAIPIGLKAKIFDRLATERGAVQRRRLWYAAATAAAILFGIGILTWHPDRRAKADLNEIVRHADHFADSPKTASDDWLASVGIHYQPPEPFNPHMLAFHGTVVVQGKQVPMLCYKSFEDGNPVSANVYILRRSDFDLTTLQKPSDGGSWGEGGHQVKVYPSTDQPDQVVYIVVYNSRDLGPFLKQYSPI